MLVLCLYDDCVCDYCFGDCLFVCIVVVFV